MKSIPTSIVKRILNHTEDLWRYDHKVKFAKVLQQILICRHSNIRIIECITAAHGFTSIGQCLQCSQRFYYDG
jgi:Ni,Fe-hydrogenase III large subunit